jgi:hypothetical protein
LLQRNIRLNVDLRRQISSASYVIHPFSPYRCSFRTLGVEISYSGLRFLRCRGLKVLVDLLDEDYAEQSELVVDALNGIGSVFELQSPTTKNDFCRMFIREGLLDPLTSALLNMMATRGDVADQMRKKIIQIILVFSQVTQSDIHVRNALGTRKIVRRRFSIIFRVMRSRPEYPSRFASSV